MKKKYVCLIMLVFLAVGLSAKEIQLEALEQEEQNLENQYLQDERAVLNLTLKEAVDLCKENNFTLRRGALDLEKSKINSYLNFNTFYPSLGLSVSGSQNLSSGSTFNWGMGLSSSFSLSATQIYQIYQGFRERETAALTYEASEQRLILQVKSLYYQLKLQQEVIAIKAAELERILLTYQINQKKFEGKILSELELLQSEALYRQNKPRVREAQEIQRQLEEQFARLIGLPLENRTLLLTTAFPDPSTIRLDRVTLEEEGIEQNIEIRTLLRQLRQYQEKKESAILSFLPSLSLGFSYSNRFVDSGEASTSFSAGFSFSLANFLPFSSAQGNLILNSVDRKKKELELEEALWEKNSQLILLLEKLDRLGTLYQEFVFNETLTMKALDLSERSYNAGVLSFLSLKESQNNASQAAYDRITSAYQYYESLVELEYLIGKEILSLEEIGE